MTRNAAAPGLGLLVLLALPLGGGQYPKDARTVGAGEGSAVRVTVFTPRVLRFLAVQFHHYTDEFGACLLGVRRGDTLVVTQADPADVDPWDLTPTTIHWWRTCHVSAPGSVGMIHAHPHGTACYFRFPPLPPGRIRSQLGGDSAWTQDAVYFFERPAFMITAIMCGDHILWMGRDSVAQVTSLPNALRASWLSHHERAP